MLKDKLLLLLRAGCDPRAVDNDGLSVCDYAEREHLSNIWQEVWFQFEAEQQGIDFNTDQRLEDKRVELINRLSYNYDQFNDRDQD